jgi:putative toxin-antitoxin system antitoxin component (TIGR02293 family)
MTISHKSEESSFGYNTKKSIERARAARSERSAHKIALESGDYVWTNTMDRLNIIRKGLPYDSIEVLSSKTNLPVKYFLSLFELPQTTYNKKKREDNLLSGRDTEVVLLLIEILDFGLDVFNNEEDKFQRWIKKLNLSLGGVSPASLFDSITGIQEVRNSLNRLEYGNLA